jgi:hypothetical protein
MQTILEFLDLTAAATSNEQILQLIEGEFETCINNGDLLGAGEWYASRLDHCPKSDADALIAKILAMWASPSDLSFSPSSIKDLIANMERFNRDDLALGLAGLMARRIHTIESNPSLLKDPAFRLSAELERLFGEHRDRPIDTCTQAAAHVNRALAQAQDALRAFTASKCVSARTAALEIVKKNRQLKAFSIRREHPLLSRAEALLGGAFREFCQSYERGETQKIVLRVPEIRQQAQDEIADAVSHSSVVWQLLVKPVAQHLITLTDEASRTCKLAVTPALKLATNLFKVDLTSKDSTFRISARLLNEGVGNAERVRLHVSQAPFRLDLVSPRGPFDMAGGGERVLLLECGLSASVPSLSIPVSWICKDITGEPHTFRDTLRLEQQRSQPEWGVLLDNPPYTVNPIKTRNRLFGREAQLNELLLHSAAGTSTFVWGQKRVGKTSLLQVLMNELSGRDRYACVFLRMGELAGMHEGQIAHVIAARITSRLPGSSVAVPSESEFGAGLGRLVPFVETLMEHFPNWRLIIIIDEFDDLDPAFYTGERGRLFVKALRSLSEIGLTLLFAGSERMNVIYIKHSLELNKWTNLFLDSISSLQDCRDLITRPVENMLEYEPPCVDGIVDYCRGNPFYMHLACQALFKRCVADRRTHISEADFRNERDTLRETLGQTNFAHLWEDNPILDKDENKRFSAENCLILCCIASLRSAFTSPQQVWEQQDSLNLTSTERLSAREISMGIERLRTRRVLSDLQSDGRIRVLLPIFNDWLLNNAELTLLPIWRRFSADKATHVAAQNAPLTVPVSAAEAPFPIAEDILLPLSQRLVFCGKQKDVAELRFWLRQFDDDNRIEIACVLLRRLAERGYVSDGAREYAISKLIEGVNAFRLETGSGKWNVFRARRDNLCVSYVDSEVKSGASLARDVMKRLGPGKTGDGRDISGWLHSHVDADPLLIIVDDFSGTGSTICNGLKKWKSDLKDPALLETYLDQGRVMFGLLYSFGEALDVLRNLEPRIRYFSANTFGPEVKAFDQEAGIFESAEEIDFAREIMLQIGRELTPQSPLGFGDQAALITFHNTIPNNTLPIFWSNGRVNERNWAPLFSRV